MTPQQIEAMKLALEALELCNGAETVEGVVIYTDKEITAIKEALAEHAMRETQRLGQEIEQEPVAWRNAAIRVGEDLSSVGPDGYYDMTAQQWLDWAMEQQPHGKNSLAQPDQYAKGYADAMNWKVQNHLEHLPTAQPDQEPVSDDIASILACRNMLDAQPVPPRTWIGNGDLEDSNAYLTPPQRKPLTDEQIEQLEQDTCAMEFPETVRAIEAAHGIKENT